MTRSDIVRRSIRGAVARMEQMRALFHSVCTVMKRRETLAVILLRMRSAGSEPVPMPMAFGFFHQGIAADTAGGFNADNKRRCQAC